MKSFQKGLLGLAQSIQGAVRERRFWVLFFRTFAALTVVTLILELPAFWLAKRKDELRALEILENRRNIFGKTFAQSIRLVEKVDSSADSREVDFHMRTILDTPTPAPGVVAIGIIQRDEINRPWVLHRHLSRVNHLRMQDLLVLPDAVQCLNILSAGGPPQLSRLFNLPGPSTNQEHAACLLFVPLKPSSKAHPGKGDAAQMFLIDPQAWSREIYLPSSLRLLRFYIANEPPDGVIASFNPPPNNGSFNVGELIHVEPITGMRDTPAGLLAFLVKKQKNPRTPKRRRIICSTSDVAQCCPLSRPPTPSFGAMRKRRMSSLIKAPCSR